MKSFSSFLYLAAALMACLVGFIIYQQDQQNEPVTAVASPEPETNDTPLHRRAPSFVSTEELANRYSQGLVVVDGDAGQGSGFLVDYQGAPVFMTNAHVLSGNKTFRAKSLTGPDLKMSSLEIAKGADIARAIIKEDLPSLPMSESVEKDVMIGDKVVVLGNSYGAGVVTQVSGSVTGIGPDLVEVNAKFVPGNSGSPVIHIKTGKVIGIATFLLVQEQNSTGRFGSSRRVERRFAYRIDTVTSWEPITWPSFVKEAEVIKKVEDRIESLVRLAEGISSGGGRLDLRGYMNPDDPLYEVIRDFHGRLNRPNLARQVYVDEGRRFHQTLVREATRGLDPSFYANFTDYHRRKVQEHAKTGEALKGFFRSLDNFLK